MVIDVYVCPECDEDYAFEEDARECCAPPIRDAWKCGNCMTVYWGQTEAIECCGKDALKTTEGWARHIQELETAGQLRLAL